MNCTSCNAQLAPGSSSCFFCGASQPTSPRAPSAMRSTWQPQAPTAAYGQWTTPGANLSETWRVWASFFLGGLYGPIAGQYLLQREEWGAGMRAGSLPPSAPSQRGLVVLGLFVALPVFFVGVLGFVINAADVRRSWEYYEANIDAWSNTSQAYGFAWLNVLIAGFYVLSVLIARMNELRFEVLLSEVTGADPAALREFRRGATLRTLASIAGIAPMLVIVEMNTIMVATEWAQHLQPQALLYLALCAVAAWATSWLNISPAGRFRAVLISRP